MPHPLENLASSPWLLAVVFAVAALDALFPFMPSESTVVAAGVLSAGTQRPHIALVILAAAAGAYLGDWFSYRIGRGSNRVLVARLQRGRRTKQVHDWVHRLLHHRGGLVIVFARYLPGGRAATAFAAGVVGYPGRRFALWTGVGVVLWAIEAALLGFLGGTVFAGRPAVGLAVAWLGALALTGVALLLQRIFSPAAAPSPPTSRADPGTPDPAPTGRRTAP